MDKETAGYGAPADQVIGPEGRLASEIINREADIRHTHGLHALKVCYQTFREAFRISLLWGSDLGKLLE
eukprot:718711-Amphidinium_carterae.1